MFQKLTPAIRLAILFFVVGSIWILLSDKIVMQFVANDVDLLDRIQSVKGISFVILCSFLLFFVARRYYRQISRSLKQSEELLNRYKALGKATKEGIIDLDLESDKAEINEQMRHFMQEDSFDVEHFTVKFRRRIHPEDRERVEKNLQATFNTSAEIWQADYRYLLNGEKYHDVISRGYIIRDEQKKPLRMISAIQDVTEIRNIKSAMFLQELKHRQLLGRSIIKSQEQERNRWALELHDNVSQLLTVVILYLEQISKDPAASPSLISKAGEMTEKALNDIRQLSASIKPPEFSITSLSDAIIHLIANIQRVKTYDFSLLLNEMNEAELKDEQKLMIYRVVQEQLNNIIKYAEASEISIQVNTEGTKVSIVIRDNGKGFDASKVESGIGLRNIRSRLQVYAGNMNIESEPGKGCRLVAEFSLL